MIAGWLPATAQEPARWLVPSPARALSPAAETFREVLRTHVPSSWTEDAACGPLARCLDTPSGGGFAVVDIGLLEQLRAEDPSLLGRYHIVNPGLVTHPLRFVEWADRAPRPEPDATPLTVGFVRGQVPPALQEVIQRAIPDEVAFRSYLGGTELAQALFPDPEGATEIDLASIAEEAVPLVWTQFVEASTASGQPFRQVRVEPATGWAAPLNGPAPGSCTGGCVWVVDLDRTWLSQIEAEASPIATVDLAPLRTRDPQYVTTRSLWNLWGWLDTTVYASDDPGGYTVLPIVLTDLPAADPRFPQLREAVVSAYVETAFRLTLGNLANPCNPGAQDTLLPYLEAAVRETPEADGVFRHRSLREIYLLLSTSAGAAGGDPDAELRREWQTRYARYLGDRMARYPSGPAATVPACPDDNRAAFAGRSASSYLEYQWRAKELFEAGRWAEAASCVVAAVDANPDPECRERGRATYVDTYVPYLHGAVIETRSARETGDTP